eukprot:CAMPEP_0201691952 /NCGR_PEP_ID=MMETSP0578-20130828/4982_1 /ASSEMBLY_ACC=CAM_ASM_000663 /TAXON_ID=267565 /ORGANISM="Skeletonema grethea, Strain CCMP 1804" /LENGTH=71 /DNA_ID=CAMNT_0048177255 /DNA_START=1 /DNA_END=212 /DNA_ORIENTATION=-
MMCTSSYFNTTSNPQCGTPLEFVKDKVNVRPRTTHQGMQALHRDYAMARGVSFQIFLPDVELSQALGGVLL